MTRKELDDLQRAMYADERAYSAIRRLVERLEKELAEAREAQEAAYRTRDKSYLEYTKAKAQFPRQ